MRKFLYLSLAVAVAIALCAGPALAGEYEDLMGKVNWKKDAMKRVLTPSTTPTKWVVEGKEIDCTADTQEAAQVHYCIKFEESAWTPPEGWETVKKGPCDVKQLTYYNPGSLEYDPAQAWNNIVFEKKTGIKINAIVTADAETALKITSTLKARDKSIHWISASDREQLDYMYAGWIEKSDFLWEEKQLISHYLPMATEGFKYKGHYYGTPWQGRLQQIMYRKDLWQEKLGHKNPPQTWQEMIDAGMATMRKEGKEIKRYGLVLQMGRHGQHYTMENLMFTQGVSSKDMLQVDEDTGRAVPQWNNDEGKRALQFVVDVVRKYQLSPEGIVTFGDSDVYDMYISDRASQGSGHTWANFKVIQDRMKGKVDDKVSAGNWGIYIWPKSGGWDAGEFGKAAEGKEVGHADVGNYATNVFAEPCYKVATNLYLDYQRSYYAEKYETCFEQNQTYIKDIYDDPYCKAHIQGYDLIKDSVLNEAGDVLVHYRKLAAEEAGLKILNKAVLGKSSVTEAIEEYQDTVEELIME